MFSITDFTLDEGCLATVPINDLSELRQTARFLRLAVPLDYDIPGSLERIQLDLPKYGYRLWNTLDMCVNNADHLPTLEFCPPASPDQLPVRRCWIPYDKGIILPWTVVHEQNGQPLFIDPRISLVHYRKQIGSSRNPKLINLRSILVAVAMPKHSPSANVELQRQEIERVRISLAEEGKDLIRWFEGRDLDELRNRLSKDDVNALHVIAHGTAGHILWQDRNQEPIWVSAQEFAACLQRTKLDFVLFTVCDSAIPDLSGESLISAVVDIGVHAVIGMQSLLDDVAAAYFSCGFYSGLRSVSSTSIDRLLSEARGSVRNASQNNLAYASSQWALPVLLLRDSPLQLSLQPDKGSQGNIAHAYREMHNIAKDIRVPRSNLDTRVPHADRNVALIELISPDRNPCRIELKSLLLRIGRSSKADIVIEDSSVSPYHASIRRLGSDDFELCDEYSSTGTWLNGKRIIQAKLKHHDEVRIGKSKLVFIQGAVSQ